MLTGWKTAAALTLLAAVSAAQGATRNKGQKFLAMQQAKAIPEKAAAMADSRRAIAEKNRKDSEAFLAENRSKEGVVTLESGLQYRILTAGAGDKPTLKDTVVVEYRGTFINGTEFTNSRTRGKPGIFPVIASIKGWQEALQLMPVGSTWQLFVPPHLAYGERGAGGLIRPNATLVFETQLVAIKQPEEKAARADTGSRAEAVARQDSAAGADSAARPDAGLREIKVSFKVDTRLTRGLYMGDRWVSSPTFAPARQGKTATVEAAAEGVHANGKRVTIKPQWIPSDPGMVEITQAQGGEAQIHVKRAGESKVKVVAQGLTKELAIKAVDQGDAIAVEIAQ